MKINLSTKNISSIRKNLKLPFLVLVGIVSMVIVQIASYGQTLSVGENEVTNTSSTIVAFNNNNIEIDADPAAQDGDTKTVDGCIYTYSYSKFSWTGMCEGDEYSGTAFLNGTPLSRNAHDRTVSVTIQDIYLDDNNNEYDEYEGTVSMQYTVASVKIQQPAPGVGQNGYIWYFNGATPSILDAPNAPQSLMLAVMPSDIDGSFTWNIQTGANEVSLESIVVPNSIFVDGVAPSEAYGDISVTATSDLNGTVLTSPTLTVLVPETYSSVWVNDSDYVSPFGFEWYGYVSLYQINVTDQFAHTSMPDGVPMNEDFGGTTINMTAELHWPYHGAAISVNTTGGNFTDTYGTAYENPYEFPAPQLPTSTSPYPEYTNVLFTEQYYYFGSLDSWQGYEGYATQGYNGFDFNVGNGRAVQGPP